MITTYNGIYSPLNFLSLSKQSKLCEMKFNIDCYDIDAIIEINNIDYVVTLCDGIKHIVPFSNKSWHEDVYHIRPEPENDIDDMFYREFIIEFKHLFPDVHMSKKEEFKMCKLLWNEYQNTFK